jgi:predicted RNA-binding Zn ribbon-like protein
VTRASPRQARELREAIDSCVQAAVGGGGAAGEWRHRWLAGARRCAGAARRRGGRTPVLGELAPVDAVRRALGAVALDAAHMLGTHAEAARIRVCASQTCSARFYDRSPAARRRWCSMAMCGNEAKARRHRERSRGATA